MVVLVEFGEDVIDGTVDHIHRDLAFFAGFDETAEKFFSFDGFAGSVALDDAEFGAFDLFVGGEAGAAFEALATSADRGAVLRRTGIDHLIEEMTTLDTAHGGKGTGRRL